jgi:hypothetical protein
VRVRVSAGNGVADSRGNDTAYNIAGLATRTVRTPQGWRATLFVPWQGLGVAAPKDGEVWGVNLSRMDQPGKADFRLMEMSSLAVISGGDPAAIHCWGHLVFGAATDLAQAPAHAARRAAVDARLAADAAKAKAEQARLATHWGLPANPNASEDVHKIVAWLAGLRDRKDKRFIVGMADGDPRFKEVFEKSGCWPAMRHFSYTDPVSEYDKPFAFTEFGNWNGPVPGDALDLIRGVREKYPFATFSVHWGSWPGNPASLADSLNVDKLMKHPWVITRENLDWRGTKVDLEKSRARKPL